MSYFVSVKVDYLDLTFEVSGEYTPPIAARISGPPEHCDPGEPSEWEDVEVYLCNSETREHLENAEELSGFLSVVRMPGKDERTVLDYLLEEAESLLDRQGDDEEPSGLGEED